MNNPRTQALIKSPNRAPFRYSNWTDACGDVKTQAGEAGRVPFTAGCAPRQAVGRASPVRGATHDR